jgi:putative tricarboxylic transport membrane protein
MGEDLLGAALVAFDPINLLLVFAGAVLGILFGATPGVSATLSIALLVPLTFGMDAVQGLSFLGGVYCGAIFGGSISSILINVPGTPAAVATMLDGYELTKQGKAGLALGGAITASFFGGQIGVLVLLFAAPAVAAWALHIRSAEFFWIVVFAMSTVGAIGTGSVVKGLIAAVLGLLLGAVGTHPFTGSLRFTFGEQALYEGFPVIVGIVGLFSISQVLYLCHGRGTDTQLDIPTIGPMWPGWARMLGVKITYIRSAIIGTFIGLLPGAGADIAAFIGRSEAHRFSRRPDEYGKGSYEAVVGAEAANNAVVGGSLIPMLTLGIPGNAVTAALIGGLLIHGIIPGPRLFAEQPHVIYPFILSLLAANLFFSIAAFGGLRYLAKVVLIPRGVLAPAVAVLSVLGAFSYRNMLADVWLMLFLGVIGYILRRTGFPLAPIILGIILGPLAESNLERVMTIARARRMSLMDYFLQNEVTIVLMVLTIGAVGLSVLREIRHQRSGRGTAPTGDE